MNGIKDTILVFVISILGLSAISCRFDVHGPNRAPIAVAGQDLVVTLGQTANIDGSKSYDPEGGVLEFTWLLLSRPPKSNANIQSNGASASLLADMEGLYLIGLVATDDEQAKSQLDVLQVRVLAKDRCDSDSDCDDGEVCTTDNCISKTCVNRPVADGSSCDDQLNCTFDDKCLDGKCNGTQLACDNWTDACNQGVCDEESGACRQQPLPDLTPCDDGVWCTIEDVCLFGICTGQLRNCDPNPNTCRQAFCNEELQQCEMSLVEDGKPCDDGKFCTVSATCQAGSCLGIARDCSEVADQCNDPFCDENLDRCVAIVRDKAPCDDGLYCTLGDTCNSLGICTPGSQSPCQDECMDVCDEEKKRCGPTPAGATCTDDQIFCNGTRECDGLGDCVVTNESPCDETTCNHCQEETQTCHDVENTPCPDDLFCNGQEACDGAGACLPNISPCPETTCNHCQEDSDTCLDPDGTLCADEAFCTLNTTCLAGVCQGGLARDCVAEVGDECNDAVCVEDIDQCERVPFDPGTLCQGLDGQKCNSACDGEGKCVEHQTDIDSDGDNTPDCSDACPHDPDKIETGECGCGVSDRDTDADHTPDCKDLDDDNDNWNDLNEIFCHTDPLSSDSVPTDSDEDGVCDLLDLCAGDDSAGDSDADGMCDDIDPVGWFRVNDLPYTSGALTSAVLSDGIHVLGGATDFEGLDRYRDHYVYNIDSKEWETTPARIPDSDTWGCQAQAYKNKLYLVGGWPNGQNRLRVFDSETNRWKNLEEIPNQYSFGFVSAVVGDFLYVIGGRDGGDTNAPVNKYDFALETWTACSPIPKNHGYGSLAGTAWEDKIYVINGDAEGGDTILQIYDVETDSWSQGARLAAHHEAACAIALAGKIYFIGGVEKANSLGPYAVRDALNIYDTQTDCWTTGPSMPTARWFAAGQRIDNAFHVFGGLLDDGDASEVHEIFYP